MADLLSLLIVLIAGAGPIHSAPYAHKAPLSHSGFTLERFHPSMKSKVTLEPECNGASTRRIGRTGAVDFSVHCSTEHKERGEVAISLARYLPGHPGRSIGFIAFRHRAGVSGPGDKQKYAACRMRQGFVICRMPVEGKVTLRGRVWLRPQDVCSYPISIVAIPSSSSCSKHGCGQGLRINDLYFSRPTGCG